ncbi:MAG: hypothetical protein WDM96_06635 [Lacunisphaera sp.]
MLNAVGMTIVFPLFPFLIGRYVPEARVAVVLSALVSVFALCQFLAAPIFGALSDRYGRKTNSDHQFARFGCGLRPARDRGSHLDFVFLAESSTA